MQYFNEVIIADSKDRASDFKVICIYIFGMFMLPLSVLVVTAFLYRNVIASIILMSACVCNFGIGAAFVAEYIKRKHIVKL